MALEINKRRPRDILFGQDLTVEWKDGAVSHFPLVDLRDACPCASCVDELTGRKVLDPKTIPAGISIRSCDYVGNYAIRIAWSDGHDSGIYAFRFLRDLAELMESARPGPAPGGA